MFSGEVKKCDVSPRLFVAREESLHDNLSNRCLFTVQIRHRRRILGRGLASINRIVVMVFMFLAIYAIPPLTITLIRFAITECVVSIPCGPGCGKDKMISRAFVIEKRASSPIAAHRRGNKAVLDDSSLDAVCGMIDYMQFGFNREVRLKIDF